MNDIVIGSGPAGVAVAKALLARGRAVTLVDGGKRLESHLDARRESLAALPADQWHEEALETYCAPNFSAPEGQARRFGSDFAMEPAGQTIAGDAPWLGLRASRAVGGLSNLWGTAVLPYSASDMAGWPISPFDLASHYSAVRAFMPLSAAASDGPGLRPLFDTTDMAPDGALAHSHQASATCAVSGACKACGLCLHGCPWGFMYSSRQTLQALRDTPLFDYRPGHVVQQFAEDENGVRVTLAGHDDLRGSRLFVAAGVLETARLVLASGLAGDSLSLHDSQHAFVPMLHRWRPSAPVDKPPLTTLPQIFAELSVPEISSHLIHAQLYTWNRFFAHDLISNYGHGLPLAASALRALARRLIVAQIFLHSDHSARIQLRLAADGRLAPQLHENPDTGKTLKAARRQLARLMRHAGLTTLGFASRPGTAGSSFHVGASLPMATTPRRGQSDTLGRPYGLNRIHLVDASVLPAIPATTITFSVMANAHRIGTLAP